MDTDKYSQLFKLCGLSSKLFFSNRKGKQSADNYNYEEMLWMLKESKLFVMIKIAKNGSVINPQAWQAT